MEPMATTRGRALLLLLLTLAACGTRDDAKPKPEPGATSAHHPDSAAALRRCAAGMGQAASVPVEDKATVIMASCRLMYARPACHDAWAAKPGPGSAEAIVRACRDAYCGDLPEPRPPLCAAWPADDADVRAGWPALDEAILRFDHGPLEGPGRDFLAHFTRLSQTFLAGTGAKLPPAP
jgi:hypothetical protein